MLCKFSLKLNVANRGHFLALWVWKLRDKLNKRKAKLALNCSFQKVIQMLAFRGGEKFDNSKFLVLFDSQLYKL